MIVVVYFKTLQAHFVRGLLECWMQWLQCMVEGTYLNLLTVFSNDLLRL